MPLLEFVAGWISGATGLVVGHPMDTVKVRLQTQPNYKGILDCVTRTYRQEGIHGFFKGMSFPVLSVAVSNSVAFGSYSNALKYLTQLKSTDHNQDKRASLTAVYIAGSFSGAAQVVISAPTDLIKVRLQGQLKTGERYRGPVHCLMVIVKEDGPRGLFRGMGALILRDVPCFGLYFLPYELVLRMLTDAGKQPGTCAVLMAGGVAGVVTWACATPMDVIKARLQLSGAGGQVYRGVLHCMRTSMREEGVQVFFKGLLLNSLRAFPVNAVTFLGYESLMKAMSPPVSHKDEACQIVTPCDNS